VRRGTQLDEIRDQVLARNAARATSSAIKHAAAVRRAASTFEHRHNNHDDDFDFDDYDENAMVDDGEEEMMSTEMRAADQTCMTMTTSQGATITLTMGNILEMGNGSEEETEGAGGGRKGWFGINSRSRSGGSGTTQRRRPSLKPAAASTAHTPPPTPPPKSPEEVVVSLGEWAAAAGVESEQELLAQVKSAAVAKNKLVRVVVVFLA
jgi:hypothetical protein